MYKNHDERRLSELPVKMVVTSMEGCMCLADVDVVITAWVTGCVVAVMLECEGNKYAAHLLVTAHDDKLYIGMFSYI